MNKSKQNNLNQFYKYKSQIKFIPNIYPLAQSLNQILNNIFCTYSFPKGKTKWRKINSTIPNPFRQKISIEIYHVESGHGIDQARLAVKSEMEEYIEYLISAYINKYYKIKEKKGVTTNEIP